METQHSEKVMKQELANSISHGFGILFGVVCIPLLIAYATKAGTAAAVVGACVYGFSFLMVYTFSTLYHSFQQIQVKTLLKKLDHISIYFLIAGTYTPFILIYLNNAIGITMLATLWGLTLTGIVFKIFHAGKYEKLSVAIYLLMGWILLAAGKAFFLALPVPVISLVAAGGILYTLGVFFYVKKSFTYHHAIWHFFVLAAGICHFVAVLLAVAPQRF
jgi:hemolysin III